MHCSIGKSEAREDVICGGAPQTDSVLAGFMLEVFTSVGASTYDLTVTNSNGDKKSFRKAVQVARLRQNLPSILDGASSHELNVIVRPVPGPLARRPISEDAVRRATAFLQLDDHRRAVD